MAVDIKQKLTTGLLVSISTYSLLMVANSFLVSLEKDLSVYTNIRNTVLVGLVFIMNSLFIFFFISNGASLKNNQSDRISFAFAFLGTYLPIFFNFKDFVVIPFVDIVIGLSVIFAIVSVIRLGKSTDILVSNRGIVTKGTYSLIRHPLYASYLLTNMLYILISPMYIWRTVLFLFWVVCIYMRIFYEEKLLLQSKDYKKYTKTVPYRIIPYVW